MDAGRAIGLVWPIRAQPGDPRLAWGPGRGICPQGVGTLRSSSRYMDVMSRGDPGSGRVVSEGDSGNRDLPGLGAPCTVTAFEPRVADTWTPGFLSTQGAGGQNGTLSHNETKRSLGVPASQQVWAWLLHAVSSLCARPPLCPRSLQACGAGTRSSPRRPLCHSIAKVSFPLHLLSQEPLSHNLS